MSRKSDYRSKDERVYGVVSFLAQWGTCRVSDIARDQRISRSRARQIVTAAVSEGYADCRKRPWGNTGVTEYRLTIQGMAYLALMEIRARHRLSVRCGNGMEKKKASLNPRNLNRFNFSHKVWELSVQGMVQAFKAENVKAVELNHQPPTLVGNHWYPVPRQYVY